MSDTYVTKINSKFIAASEVVPNSPLATTLATLGAAGAYEVVSLNANGKPNVANPSTKVIYLTKSSTAGLTDPYTEWIYTGTNGEAAVESKWEIIGETTIDLSGYKRTQTAVNDPSASGNTLTAIATISQDAQGVITATKKTIQDGTTSQKGVVQLQDSIGATETTDTKAATPKSVRDAINALDVSAIGGSGKYITTVSEADGKISATAVDFPTTMTPSSHAHGSITNDGKIGTTANLSVVTGTGGAVTTKDLTVNAPSASGNSVEFIDSVSQASDGKITASKKTVSTMGGANGTAAGTAGLVPAPTATDNNKFLKGDGTWSTVATSDTKVTQTVVTSSDTSEYPVLYAPSGQTSTTTTTAKFATAAKYKPSTNTLSVNISGDAATASAAKSGSTLDNAINGKADKVASATDGNLASLTSTGNLADSGKKASDFATSAQGTKADSAIQGVKLYGASANLTPDSGKVVTIPNAIAQGATGATNGLLTAADKLKLDGLTSGATKVESSTTNGNIKINGTETTVYTHPTTTAATAAAVKVGKDSAGHVVLGAALTASDVGAATTAQGTKADSAVQDVTVAGTSVVDSSTKVAAIQVATSAVYGVVTIETDTF